MAALAAQLKESSAMTPVEREAKKSRREKAEDIAYTINHAISCGITDLWIQVPISSWVAQKADKSKFFSTLTHFFEKHDTGVTPPVDSKHPTEAELKIVRKPKRGMGNGLFTTLNSTKAEQTEGKNLAKAVQEHHKRQHGWWRHLKEWSTGEAIGDFGAVPLTILVQRFLPGVMDSIRKVVEPIAGSIYRKGAERSARHWAVKEGYDGYGVEAQAKAAEIYEHEVSHLPQALVWNAFSIPINLGIQKYGMDSQSSWPALVAGKAFGSLFSNGVLLGGRALVPEAFGKMDDFNSRNVIMPVSKAVGSIFGVDNDTMDRVGREHDHGKPGIKISGTRYDTRLQEHPAALAAPSHG